MATTSRPSALAMRQNRKCADRLSVFLSAIARGQDRERISIADLLQALEHRAIGALMFIFAVPNAIPVPPGVSAILGAPLIFLSFQLMIGRRPWLPKVITRTVRCRASISKKWSIWLRPGWPRPSG